MTSARVVASAPCRADLAGGTLDIWPLGLLHPGAVTVNVALAVRAVVEVDREARRGKLLWCPADGDTVELGSDQAATDLTAAVAFALAPAGGLRIRVGAQAPVGSGIGGSSAYGMALALAVATLRGDALDPTQAVALVRDLEARVLAVPTGCQDHWAAVRGGVLAVHPQPGGERVEPLPVDPGFLAGRLTTFFTGVTHHSGMVNWQVLRRRFDGDAATVQAVTEIAEAAAECRAALLAGDEEGVGAAIRDEWSARRRLAPEVCPSWLDELSSRVLEAGATAVKACGAGGGGSVVVWHRTDRSQRVTELLESAVPEGRVLATGVATEGWQVDGDRPEASGGL